MKPITTKTEQQIDVFALWNQAELHLRKPISGKAIMRKAREYGVLVFDNEVKHLREGGIIRGDKVAAVVRALHEISGLPRSERVLVQSITTTSETWLEADNDTSN